jgi:beta-glucosidase
MAQTFDAALVRTFGEAMGKEFAGKGCDVQFGPGLNVGRVPWGGRNFEYLSGALAIVLSHPLSNASHAGEDPLLGYELAHQVVAGIQSQGVIANAKHYFNNNQEDDRHGVSENVDERTQMQIYMPPFKVRGEALVQRHL